LASRITKLFVIDVNVSNNVEIGGNLTVDENVGIGTMSPGFPLHIERSGENSQGKMLLATYNDQTAFASEIQFRKSHNDTAAVLTPTINGERFGTIRFRGTDSTSASDDGAIIYAHQDGAAGVKLPTNLIFSTHSSTAENTNQLVLHNDGNVGIGTTSPVKKLHLHTAADAETIIKVTNSITGTVGVVGLQIGLEASEGAQIWQNENNFLRFATNNIERMRILAGGNVGIGTTTIPHGGVGYAKFAIEGTNANAAAPIYNSPQPQMITLYSKC